MIHTGRGVRDHTTALLFHGGFHHDLQSQVPEFDAGSHATRLIAILFCPTGNQIGLQVVFADANRSAAAADAVGGKSSGFDQSVDGAL